MQKTKTTPQSTSDLSQKHQTSEIYQKTSDLMLVATLHPTVVVSCSH